MQVFKHTVVLLAWMSKKFDVEEAYIYVFGLRQKLEFAKPKATPNQLKRIEGKISEYDEVLNLSRAAHPFSWKNWEQTFKKRE